MFKKIIRSVAITVAAFSLFSLFSCTGRGIVDIGEKGEDGLGNKATPNTSGLTYFYYSYSGSIGADSYSVTVEKEGDGAKITFEGMQYEDYGEMTAAVDLSLLTDLEKLYNDCKVYQWEGYHKYNVNVLDGDGFSVTLKFADGKSMTASGSNAYPTGYGDFNSKRTELLKPHIDNLIEAGKEALIEKGVSGDLTSFMTEYKQQGESGGDTYSFIVTRSNIREDNLDITIHSESGEFIEAGDYRYYGAIADEAIDFDGVKALIEKYNVITWYDWDKSAEDYNNAEWFQVDFGFEGGKISAMGTDYPENYNEFRKELITLVISMIKNAEENYGLTQFK